MNKLLDILKMDADEIELSFKKASIEGFGTPQEVADRRENSVVNIFLRKYFPFPFRITKGNIVDSYMNNSKSIDCIILSPSHPYTVDPKNEKASIIFADGVDFAIEVKPDLSNEAELFRSLEQVRSVKKLTRKRNGIFDIGNKASMTTKLNSFKIPTVIFSEKTFSKIRTLVEKIVNYYIENDISKFEQFDLIVVNKNWVIINCRKDMYGSFFKEEGIVFIEATDDALAILLLWLNIVPRSEPTLNQNIISLYLDQNELFLRAKEFSDLNLRIKEHNSKFLNY